MANVKRFTIWNTHYLGTGDNWRVEIVYMDGKHHTTAEPMTMAQAQYYISTELER